MNRFFITITLSVVSLVMFVQGNAIGQETNPAWLANIYAIIFDSRAPQTISFTSSAPSDATFAGPTYNVTATASSGLTVALAIDASAASVCSLVGSTVSFIGVGSCVIVANQAGNANFDVAPQARQSFNVRQGVQTINFTSVAPADATFAGPTYNVTATASSGLTVSFASVTPSVCTISGSTVSFIGVGTCTIEAVQTGSANYNEAPVVSQSFAVGRGAQTIGFTSSAPANATVAGPTYNVTATASSGLTVAFVSATPSFCTISGSTVSFIAVGLCAISAVQSGSANYNAAPPVSQSFAVGKGSQSISFTSFQPSDAAMGGATYNVTATASSGLTVALTIDPSAASVCSLAGSTVSFIGTGTCTINANQAGNVNYNAAPMVQQSVSVGRDPQTIAFTSAAPADATVAGPTYNVTATASSGLTVAFVSATPSICTISGSTVSFIAVGLCVISAVQSGNANYNAAPSVSQSFAVGKGSQSISFTSFSPGDATVGGATYNVTATASSGLTVALTIDPSAASVCSLAGSTVSFIGAGTCTINANQAESTNYNVAPQQQQSFAVGKTWQTIGFSSSPPSDARVGGATYNVTATASSGLTVALTIDASASSVCRIVGSTVSFTGTGTCVINGNQAGDTNYYSAPQIQMFFAVD